MDVKQKASPARHDVAIPAMGPVKKGIDMKAPMVDGMVVVRSEDAAGSMF